MNDFFNWRQRGIPMAKINRLMAGITVVMSVLLLIITYQTGVSYRAMRDTTEQYIDWRTQAYNLQIGSDYLTEQVRCFAETGERRYLDNYFEEATVTRRREKALEALGEDMKETVAYQALEEAMSESVALMEREYYAMRLTVEANGEVLSEFPEAIQAVQLSPADARLTAPKQAELARKLVFDDVYHDLKSEISADTQRCLSELTQTMDALQANSTSALQEKLQRQRALIIALIAITLSIVLLTSLLVISPLLRAVLQIRDDQRIPVRGAYEFRFLAQTYNLMYEVNKQSQEHLAFEASHDKLTGLYNRGGYDYLIENARLKESALLLVDVDHFKDINDKYGHEIGDKALAWIASVIRGSFRAQDHVCRIGGDEFAVIMQPIGPHLTALIQEKVRNINRTLQVPPEGLPPTSVSVGVAFGLDDASAQGLYENADAALYKVKFNGRQGCAFHEG